MYEEFVELERQFWELLKCCRGIDPKVLQYLIHNFILTSARAYFLILQLREVRRSDISFRDLISLLEKSRWYHVWLIIIPLAILTL